MGVAPHKASITVAPSRPEWGLARERYEDFVAELQVEGHIARLEEPEAEERRSGGGAVELSVVWDVAIYLGEHLADETIGAIVALALDRLRRRSKRRRRGVIYGPDGEVLRRFELPPQDD